MNKKYTKIARDILAEIASYQEEKDKVDGLVSLDKKGNKEQLSIVSDSTVDTDQGYMVLLSEGSLLYNDGTIRLYITKGTIEKWYNSIDDSFEGYVTTGHVSTDSNPIREGYFTKENLKIVNNKDGRVDLLVKPVVNLELSNVKDLIIQNEPFAISAELLAYPASEEVMKSDEYEILSLYNQAKGGSEEVSVTDTIEIQGFSFVGNPGNAKSGGYLPQVLVSNEKERIQKLDKNNILDKLLLKLSQEEAQEAVEEQVGQPQEEVKEEVKQEEQAEQTPEEDVLAKATEKIEQLQKELEVVIAERDELREFKKEALNAQEAQNTKLEKLAVLLDKVNPEIEQPVEKVQTEERNGLFPNGRFNYTREG